MQVREQGIERIIFTDIDRDGLLEGINARSTGELAWATGMRVIASGGVAGVGDVRKAAALAPLGVDGLIIGRALYDERVDLREALKIAAQVKNDREKGG